MDSDKSYEAIELILSEDLLKIMEERSILKEDIQQVIEHAQRSGLVMKNRENDHLLAHFCPDCVTYWVEYRPSGTAFEVFNAYCHRMTVEEKVRYE